MNITFSRQTALAITRALRAAGKRSGTRHTRCNIVDPDPSPQKRFSCKQLTSTVGAIAGVPLEQMGTIDIAVSDETKRPRARDVRCTTYSSSRALPRDSFFMAARGIAISCPELLFVEMANILTPAEHLLLGYELCGCFTRDAADPRNGNITDHIPAATSVMRIKSYLDRAHWLRGADRARETLGRLADNAWSPTEAVVATLVSLPLTEFGYELGPCTLNLRLDTPDSLARTTDAASRVPDIIFEGTSIGINYDGAVHLDLPSIVSAAREAERDPDNRMLQRALEQTVRAVREKAIDDIHRNRELAADGYLVFPVVKEDLYEYGSFDRVMLQVMEAMEHFDERDLSQRKRLISMPAFVQSRQELIWSLMPGNREERTISMPPTGTVYEVRIGF